MTLTHANIKNATTEKPRKLFDANGLFLLLTPSRSPEGGTLKHWRFKYRFDGKERLLALGVFPEISLSEAHESRDNARAIIRKGRDPAVQRKAEKAARVEAGANTFEVVAREWHGNRAKALEASTLSPSLSFSPTTLI